MSDITVLLNAIQPGDPEASAQLLPLVYDELRRLAARRLAREAPGQTLQPTALVHEAYLRLVGDEAGTHWDGRAHFFAACAEAMRRILIENARHKRSRKRGGHLVRQELNEAELLASGGEDKTVRLHYVAEGRSKKFRAPNVVNDVAFSADSRTLAAVGDASAAAVSLWDLETGEETTWKGHTGHVHGLAFSPGATLLATCAEDGTVRLWDRTGGEPRVRTIGPGPFGGPVRAVAFTPDGRFLVTANANGTVYVLRAGDPNPE